MSESKQEKKKEGRKKNALECVLFGTRRGQPSQCYRFLFYFIPPLVRDTMAETPIVPVGSDGISKAHITNASITLNLSPTCYVDMRVAGPWSNALSKNMKALYADRMYDVDRVPQHGPLFVSLSELSTQSWGEWLPHLHFVARLFGGRIYSHSHLHTAHSCVDAAAAMHLVASATPMLTGIEGSGSVCQTRLLSHCLALWSETPDALGRGSDSVCAVFFEQLPEDDLAGSSMQRFQLSRVTLACKPGWSFFGWTLSNPFVALKLESATLHIRCAIKSTIEDDMHRSL